MDPEFSKGGFSLGEQLGRRKVWPKGRQGASVFLTDRAAGAEEEARSRDGGKAEGEVTLVDRVAAQFPEVTVPKWLAY